MSNNHQSPIFDDWTLWGGLYVLWGGLYVHWSFRIWDAESVLRYERETEERREAGM